MKTESELAKFIADASGPLSVTGGDTRGMAGPGQALSVKGLNGITLYEPGALTMVAQAGTPVAVIEKALAKENQRLAFEPMDHRALLGGKGKPTIGGVFAANVSGPRRMNVGAARDHLLGVRFVDGAGNIIKNGGRVMKNVTGYDLVKLMAGSFGQLGVLSEVSFKVLPCPETQATLAIHGLNDADAITVMAAALGSPFEVTGAAHDPAASATYLRVEGFEASITYRIEQLKALLGADQMSVVSAKLSNTLWQGLRDAKPLADKPGDIWRVSCKPSEGPTLAKTSGALDWFYDWAGGLIWLRTGAGHDLRAAMGGFEGHATLVRAADDVKARLGTFHPETPGVARITQGLRARFDPKGLFSPMAGKAAA
jgi:glycolate oxidase FAD binding subunit